MRMHRQKLLSLHTVTPPSLNSTKSYFLRTSSSEHTPPHALIHTIFEYRNLLRVRSKHNLQAIRPLPPSALVLLYHKNRVPRFRPTRFSLHVHNNLLRTKFSRSKNYADYEGYLLTRFPHPRLYSLPSKNTPPLYDPLPTTRDPQRKAIFLLPTANNNKNKVTASIAESITNNTPSSSLISFTSSSTATTFAAIYGQLIFQFQRFQQCSFRAFADVEAEALPKYRHYVALSEAPARF